VLSGLGDFSNGLNVNAMEKALEELKNLTYEEAKAKGEGLIKQKALNESLTNAPQGFKVAEARFRATRPDLYSGNPYNPITRDPPNQNQQASNQQAQSVNVQTMIVQANNPVALMEEIERMNRQRQFQTTATIKP
jgi:hypothetical protein